MKRLRRTEVCSPQSNILYSPKDASLEIRRIDLLPDLQKEIENEDEFSYDGLISNVRSPTKKQTPSLKCTSIENDIIQCQDGYEGLFSDIQLPKEENIPSQTIDSSSIIIPIAEYDRLQEDSNQLNRILNQSHSRGGRCLGSPMHLRHDYH